MNCFASTNRYLASDRKVIFLILELNFSARISCTVSEKSELVHPKGKLLENRITTIHLRILFLIKTVNV